MRGGNLACHLRPRAESREVCGWRAGDSLDSRGDRWELRQTHERAQVLGESQLSVEILGELLRAGCPCGKLLSMC